MKDDEPDHRYTIRVYLYREGRPRYWSFHCPSCGKKVCEVNGTLIYLTDLTNDGQVTGIMGASRVQCKQKFCRFWFEFNM